MKDTNNLDVKKAQIRIREIGIIRMEGLNISETDIKKIADVSNKIENQSKLYMVFDFNTSSRLIDLHLIKSGLCYKRITNIPAVPNGVNIYHFLSVVNCPDEFPNEQHMETDMVSYEECVSSFNDYMQDIDEEYNERFESSVKEIININI